MREIRKNNHLFQYSLPFIDFVKREQERKIVFDNEINYPQTSCLVRRQTGSKGHFQCVLLQQETNLNHG